MPCVVKCDEQPFRFDNFAGVNVLDFPENNVSVAACISLFI